MDAKFYKRYENFNIMLSLTFQRDLLEKFYEKPLIFN